MATRLLAFKWILYDEKNSCFDLVISPGKKSVQNFISPLTANGCFNASCYDFMFAVQEIPNKISQILR